MSLIVIAVIGAVIYSLVYLREKAGSARPRRMQSASISAIALISFAGFLALRVVFHS